MATPHRPTRLPRGARLALRWVSRLLFALVCAAVVGIVVVLTVLPRATDGAALTVLTGSMTPDIPVGSVVLLRPVDPQTLQVGDIATYQVSPESTALVTHRIVEITGSGEDLRFVFKGDANRGLDAEPVAPQAIRGEVWFHVPYLGSMRDSLDGRAGISLVVVVGLLGYAALQLTGGLRDRKRRPEGDQEGSTERTLVLDRSAVVADLPRPAGEDPTALARSCGGLLLAADEETVTVLLLPAAEEAGPVLELLELLGADRTECWDPGATVHGVVRRTTAREEQLEVDRATG